LTIKKITYSTPTTGTSTTNTSFIEGSETVGGENTLLIADMSSRELLEGIYIELKKLNLRQEVLTGEQVNDEDVK